MTNCPDLFLDNIPDRISHIREYAAAVPPPAQSPQMSLLPQLHGENRHFGSEKTAFKKARNALKRPRNGLESREGAFRDIYPRKAKGFEIGPFFAMFHFGAMQLDKTGQYWTKHDNSGQNWTELDIATAGTVTGFHINCQLLIESWGSHRQRLMLYCRRGRRR